MRKLYKDRKKPAGGTTLWRNPTDQALKVKIHTMHGARQIVEVEPQGVAAFPSQYDDSMSRICRVLVRADAVQESPAHEVAPAPTMPAAEPAAAEPVADVTRSAEADAPPAAKPSRPRKKRSKRTTKAD
jgi:hypothetical protein